jgi:hypothetical protein
VHYQQKLDIELCSFSSSPLPQKEVKRTHMFLESFLDDGLFTLYQKQ